MQAGEADSWLAQCWQLTGTALTGVSNLVHRVECNLTLNDADKATL